jgi:hypothetical protein
MFYTIFYLSWQRTGTHLVSLLNMLDVTVWTLDKGRAAGVPVPSLSAVGPFRKRIVTERAPS